jgi:carboxyl-terminal processing protease
MQSLLTSAIMTPGRSANSSQSWPIKGSSDMIGEASLRGHLKAEGDEQTGSQSYIPQDPKDDKALQTALDLIRGVQKKPTYPAHPKTAVLN